MKKGSGGLLHSNEEGLGGASNEECLGGPSSFTRRRASGVFFIQMKKNHPPPPLQLHLENEEGLIRLLHSHEERPEDAFFLHSDKEWFGAVRSSFVRSSSRPTIRLSARSSVRPSVRPTIRLSDRPSARLPAWTPARASVRACVYPFIPFLRPSVRSKS